MGPVARLVFSQEAAEGRLRFAHMRLRVWAEEVAFYRCVEHAVRRTSCFAQ